MTSEPLAGILLPRLEITDFTVEGKAVARHEGRVVFLDRGLVGDIVSARILVEQKRVLQACVETLITPSPFRQQAWCPHHEDCGACSWQDFDPDRLLLWKQEYVRQTLKRLGGFGEIPVAPVQPSPLQRGYRNKMAFAFARNNNSVTVLGLRKRFSHEIVEVTDCGLAVDPAMAIVAYVRKHISNSNLSAWEYDGGGSLRFLVLHTPEYREVETQQIVVECIIGPDPSAKKALMTMGQELIQHFGITGFVLSERRQRSDVAQGEKVLASLGQNDCLESFGQVLLKSPHDCFMQTNSGAAELVYAQVKDCAALKHTDVLWDVYCGIGGIGLFLAQQVRQVYGFDIQKTAIRAAVENSRRLGFNNCRFQAGDLRQTLLQADKTPDVIVVDPPRAGLDAEVADILATIPARRLVYVSCDVATQARDLSRLRGAKGDAWMPVQAFPVDMFPHSPHVENIVLFISSKA
jgi:23S rRNA (uracil1939-C5)-methyltransferase